MPEYNYAAPGGMEGLGPSATAWLAFIGKENNTVTHFPCSFLRRGFSLAFLDSRYSLMATEVYFSETILMGARYAELSAYYLSIYASKRIGARARCGCYVALLICPCVNILMG